MIDFIWSNIVGIIIGMAFTTLVPTPIVSGWTLDKWRGLFSWLGSTFGRKTDA